MSGWELVVSFVAGLVVNEMTDISPWAARKLVRWAAYRWTTDPEIAAGYAEEWTAIIDQRPGKLFKLVTAVQFSAGAIGRAVPRSAVAVRRGLSHRLANSRFAPSAQAFGAGLKFVFGSSMSQRFATASAVVGMCAALFQVGATILSTEMSGTDKASFFAIGAVVLVSVGAIFVKATAAVGRAMIKRRK